MEAESGRWRKRLAQRISETELSLEQNVEIFRMLDGAGLEYSKNVNGVFFDVTACDREVLGRVETFLDYCDNCATMLQDSMQQRCLIAADSCGAQSPAEAEERAAEPPPQPQAHNVRADVALTRRRQAVAVAAHYKRLTRAWQHAPVGAALRPER